MAGRRRDLEQIASVEKGRGRCDVGVLKGWDQKEANTWEYSAPEAAPQNYLDKMTEVRALTSSLEADFDRANPKDLYLETKVPISETIPWGQAFHTGISGGHKN